MLGSRDNSFTPLPGILRPLGDTHPRRTNTGPVTNFPGALCRTDSPQFISRTAAAPLGHSHLNPPGSERSGRMKASQMPDHQKTPVFLARFTPSCSGHVKSQLPSPPVSPFKGAQNGQITSALVLPALRLEHPAQSVGPSRLAWLFRL
jgi:hypothetical protein